MEKLEQDEISDECGRVFDEAVAAASSASASASPVGNGAATAVRSPSPVHGRARGQPVVSFKEEGQGENKGNYQQLRFAQSCHFVAGCCNNNVVVVEVNGDCLHAEKEATATTAYDPHLQRQEEAQDQRREDLEAEAEADREKDDGDSLLPRSDSGIVGDGSGGSSVGGGVAEEEEEEEEVAP